MTIVDGMKECINKNDKIKYYHTLNVLKTKSLKSHLCVNLNKNLHNLKSPTLK